MALVRERLPQAAVCNIASKSHLDKQGFIARLVTLIFLMVAGP